MDKNLFKYIWLAANTTTTHPVFRQRTPGCERFLYCRPYPGVL